jgi:hypothetical protein
MDMYQVNKMNFHHLWEVPNAVKTVTSEVLKLEKERALKIKSLNAESMYGLILLYVLR